MPNYFNPYQYQQQNFYPQQIQNNQPAPMSIPQNIQQMPDSNFVPAPSEEFARNYPVGYGKSVNFKDENAPYIYVKTMGFSQLDNPIFEKYRLVKEQPSEASNSPQNEKIDIQSIIESIDKANEQIELLWTEIEALKSMNTNAKEKSPSRVGNGKRDKNGDDRYDE